MGPLRSATLKGNRGGAPQICRGVFRRRSKGRAPHPLREKERATTLGDAEQEATRTKRCEGISRSHDHTILTSHHLPPHPTWGVFRRRSKGRAPCAMVVLGLGPGGGGSSCGCIQALGPAPPSLQRGWRPQPRGGAPKIVEVIRPPDHLLQHTPHVCHMWGHSGECVYCSSPWKHPF